MASILTAEDVVRRIAAERHHNHHGPRTEGAPRRQPKRAEGNDAVFSQLRPELHLCGHILEQPSSLLPPSPARRWHHAVGEPASAVLALAHPLRHQLDGGTRLLAGPYSRLRSGAADASDRLLRATGGGHPGARPRVHPVPSPPPPLPSQH